jgi:hypothetical protein
MGAVVSTRSATLRCCVDHTEAEVCDLEQWKLGRPPFLAVFPFVEPCPLDRLELRFIRLRRVVLKVLYHAQWGGRWKQCKQSEVGLMTQSALIQVSGTSADVPVTIEVSFAPGGVLEGCEKQGYETHLLTAGTGSYRVGKDVIRFGPGMKQHRYVNVRGHCRSWTAPVCTSRGTRRSITVCGSNSARRQRANGVPLSSAVSRLV